MRTAVGSTREQIVRYVMENGPCNDESIYRHVAKVGVMEMRRMLVRGSPQGKTAYERSSGNDYFFVIASRPPTSVDGREEYPCNLGCVARSDTLD